MSLIDRLRERRQSEGEDEGFTLIELLVVLLIIGILLAIAIPTFLSVTKGANGTAAQSNLQTALTGGDTYFTDNNQSYSGILTGGGSASTLTQIDTGLSYSVDGTSAKTNQIGVDLATDNGAIAFYAFAPGQNRCYAVADIKQTGDSPANVTGLPNGNTTTWYGWVKASAVPNCTTTQLSAIANWQTGGFPS